MSDLDKIVAKTARAGIWTVSGKLIAKSIDLVVLLVLARLLSPADFGLVALATAPVLIVETIFELPLISALIRHKELSDDFFATAFTLGLLRGLTVAIILCLTAFPLSLLYDEPRIVPLIAVLSISPLSRGLISPKMAVFAQQLDFRRDFLIDALAKLLSLAVAATFAFLTRSYWAIAAGMVTTAVSMMVISYVLAPYRPAFSLLQYRYFLDILGWNTVSQIMQSMNWQLNRILLPRFIDLTTFGRFTMASNLADVPQQALAQPIVRPLVAGFATASSDQARNTAYLNASFLITLTIAPIFMGIGILADPLVPLLLGEKWSHAAGFLCYLCLINILTLPAVAMPAMAVTLRATKFVAVRTGVELLVRIPVLVVSIRMAGVAGAIFTQAMTTALSMLVSIGVMRRLTGISALSQILTVGRPLLALVPAGAALAAANIATASMSNTFMRCGILLMSAGIAVVIYFSVVVLVGRTGWFPRIASEERFIERLLVRFKFKQRSIHTTDE